MNAQPKSVRWRRLLIGAFTENLPLKASALLLTIAMWFLVSAREPIEQVVGVRFQPQLDSNLVLRDPSPLIRAVVIGAPNEVLKLADTPLLIRRPIANDVPDTLVLALRPSDVEVPDGVEVIVRDVQPHSLTLRFESTASRKVPVRSAVVVRAVTGPIPVHIDPDSVTVLGPRPVVLRVARVSTVVDTLSIDTLPHLVDLDTTGLGVTVRPRQVKVSFLRTPE
jgi:hypothetical protein